MVFLQVSSTAALFLTWLLVPHAANLPHLLLADHLYLGSRIRGEVTGLAHSLCPVVMREGTLFSSSLMPQSLPWRLMPCMQKRTLSLSLSKTAYIWSYIYITTPWEGLHPSWPNALHACLLTWVGVECRVRWSVLHPAVSTKSSILA